MTQDPLLVLENKLGHKFTDKALLRQALTHASFSGPEASYERLEFLGDRVLGLLLANHFYKTHSNENEGTLSLRLHSNARMSTLAMVARKLDLPNALQIQTGMNLDQNDNVLADVVESLIAAIFLDRGLHAAEKFILDHWPLSTGSPAITEKDAKSLLQEWSLQNGLGLPTYKQISKSGPDHAPVMTYQVTLADGMHESAKGSNRKIAEQKAAKTLLARLKAGLK